LNTLSAEEQIATEETLSNRPSFSIRFRITLAFALACLFSFGIGAGSIIFLSRMDAKQEFFQQVENFSFEIEEARRYEKNFFLYRAKSDLYDALDHIHTAGKLLQNTPEIRHALNPDAYRSLVADLGTYEDLLNRLISLGLKPDSETSLDEGTLEDQLRHFGHNILSYATDVVGQERVNIRATARTLRLVSIFLIVIDFIVMGWVAVELTRQILRPLGRAVRYTDRIASGDFSPIVARHRYRDEFSNLDIAFNRMIFELRGQQEQLVQSRKMAAIGTLTSGIAHELNNPLNNISLTAETLLEGLEDYNDEQKRKLLGDIFNEVERASSTVKNLLDFTRTDISKLESVDVLALIQNSLRLVANELTLSRIKAETKFEQDLPHIRGNFRNLQQVFLNLFVNSIHAMPEGGYLRVHAGAENGKYVKVDVADTGSGIPQEHLQSIFDPFFTTKEVGKGTGLGLSICYSIIEKIGGRITVESEVNKGTVFSVYLPVDEGIS
jgi:two-component system NtrC family sensor kinase